MVILEFLKTHEKSTLSDVEHAQIMALHKEGYSERSISERVKCSKNAVHNAVMKFQKSGTYSDAKSLVVHEKPHQGMTMSLEEQQFSLQ